VAKAGRSATPRVTIKDVALRAGTSVTTVSNVLNGRTNAMTEETLRRIQDAMRDLKFRPNSVARGLVTRRTATLGLILAEIETPLFLQALTSMERDARQAGYSLLLCNARNEADERENLTLLLEKQVDGVVFISTSDDRNDDHILEARAAGVPVVLVNRAGQHADCDQINWDNADGVTTAVRHLARLGHRRIAHLSGPADRRSTVERLQGYRAGLEASGLPFADELVRAGDYTAQADSWRKATLELLAVADRPTAIIASDDIVAAVVVRTVQEQGLNVPGDVAVVGIDDQPFSTYLALSTVRLPVIEAGRQAISLLLRRLKDPTAEPEHRLLPCALVERGTCGAQRHLGVS